MEQLIELLTQIQELAGVGIDALQQVAEGGGEAAPEGEAPVAPDETGAPPPTE